MSIDFEYFRLFYSIATHCNVSKAAEELHLSQPTVTKELRKLEEQLGLTLFTRHSRGVKPTPEGEYLYQRIEPAIRTLIEAEQEVNQLIKLEAGVIHTSYNHAAVQHVFENVIASFQAAHPNITIHSSILPRASLMDAIDRGIIDIAFVARPGTAPIHPQGPGFLRNSEDISLHIKEYSLGIFDDVFLTHKRLNNLSHNTIQISDIADHPLIYQRTMDMVSRTHYQTLFSKENHNDARDLVIDDMEAIFSILKIDDYIALVSKLSADLLGECTDHIPLQVNAPMLSTEYLMHYSKNNRPCLAAMKLIEYILNHPAFAPIEIDCSI